MAEHREREAPLLVSAQPDDATGGTTASPPTSPRGGQNTSITTQATIIDLSGSSTAQLGRSTRSDSGGGGSTFDRARETANDVVQWFVAGSVWQAYSSKWAKAFVLLIFIATVLVLGVSIALLVRAYTQLRTFTVSDGTVCTGATYEEIKTNSVGYNLANVVAGVLFALWFAMRSVRLEKGSLLACVLLVIVATVARAEYFSFSVAENTLRAADRLAAQVVYTTACVVLLAACALMLKVKEGFGWRMYAKGVTESEQVETMQRYKQLDACAKFDLFVTVNAFISLFFFVSDLFLRIYGFIVAAITLVFLLALPGIVKHRRYWALYGFYVACVLMPVFYMYTLGVVITEDKSYCLADANTCLLGNGIEDRPPSWCSDNRTSSCPYRERCIRLASNSTPSERDECERLAVEAIATCCSEYGRCGLKRVFFDNDKPLIIFLAAVGCIVRVITVVIGYRQAQAMNVPSVQDMLKRGERNLKNFAVHLPTLPSFASGKARAANAESPTSPAAA